MTDIKKAYNETIPTYRALAPCDKEAFKTLADLFLYLYKGQNTNKLFEPDSNHKETKTA